MFGRIGRRVVDRPAEAGVRRGVGPGHVARERTALDARQPLARHVNGAALVVRGHVGVERAVQDAGGVCMIHVQRAAHVQRAVGPKRAVRDLVRCSLPHGASVPKRMVALEKRIEEAIMPVTRPVIRVRAVPAHRAADDARVHRRAALAGTPVVRDDAVDHHAAVHRPADVRLAVAEHAVRRHLDHPHRPVVAPDASAPALVRAAARIPAAVEAVERDVGDGHFLGRILDVEETAVPLEHDAVVPMPLRVAAQGEVALVGNQVEVVRDDVRRAAVPPCRRAE